MTLRSHLLIIAALPLLAAPARAQSADAIAHTLEAAHGKSAWYAQDAIEIDATVDFFNGELRLEGTMLFTSSLSKVRYTLDDGTVMVWNDGEVWLSPADRELEQARFHVMTWPYFAAVPFKLRDAGVNLDAAGELPVTGPGDTTRAVKLTFDRGTGDAPDDWYYLLPDDEHRLAAMSYIVTYGPTSQAEAEEKPSIVIYDDFRTEAGVTLPYRWDFYYWSKSDGAQTGDGPKGTVRVHDVRFVTPDDAAFDRPADAKPIPAPDGSP